MRLTVIGSGDAFSSGGRFPSCYMLESGGTRFLLDCGPAILPALKRAGLSSNDFPHIFISHLHGDHIGGLPFLLLDAIFPAARQEPLTLIGPPGLEARFRLACEVFYPRSLDMKRDFELRFIEVSAGVPATIGGVQLMPFEVNHYSGSPSHALRFLMDGKVFAFSGDAGWSDNVVAAGKDADLYLIECYQYDFKLSMHLDYLTIAQHFDRIGAKKLVLTHMSEAMLARHGDVDGQRCLMADDGMVIDF
ncbi:MULTISPECIES: MBL fold metallo-hydrolase [Rhodomicrobium]|uniref:MBL fold metallo-hydrolase n=1 Tax=Rhodomicrobium TaxID=1068 RepID=UPI000F7480CC|nr:MULTISPECIES: MBL fold metallo-hydrolase [Rhodomicrobium]